MKIWIGALILLTFFGSVGLAKPEIALNIPEYTLRLVDGAVVLKEYEVAVGTVVEPTPVGKFAVFYKFFHVEPKITQFSLANLALVKQPLPKALLTEL